MRVSGWVAGWARRRHDGYRSTNKATALHVAAAQGHRACVAALVEVGGTQAKNQVCAFSLILLVGMIQAEDPVCGIGFHRNRVVKRVDSRHRRTNLDNLQEISRKSTSTPTVASCCVYEATPELAVATWRAAAGDMRVSAPVANRAFR
jgi:hypothetical protein